MVETCIVRAEPLAATKNMGLGLDSSDIADVNLLGDRELMEYALYNLVNNAIKYSTLRGHVNITTAVHSGWLRIAVRDDGIGMNAQEVSKVFERFYRTKSAEASGEPGTGIGLAIVDQIVTRHGGKIDVESAPGQGSCFTIVLPPAAYQSSV